MPRIEPTKSERHGRHLDEYWPGLIYSTWKLPRITIRRERRYSDRYYRDLSRVSWQFQYDLADTTAGFRVERRSPGSSGNW